MKEIYIIGMGPGWEDAPQECDSLCISRIAMHRPAKRVIDLHICNSPMTQDYPQELQDELFAHCKAKGYELITQENYPLDAIIQALKTDYFSCSIDYSIALAIYEGYERIHLYGITMMSDSEYAYEKPGVDFWCGYAMGRGIEVVVHSALSTVMKTRNNCIYAYGYPQYLTVRFEPGPWPCK